ncbi:MAG: dynamin family protein, partial [Cyanobacteria bacterium J06598_3]
MRPLQDELIAVLQRSVGLLDDTHAEVKAEVIAACDRIDNPTYRVAVFGPFNYGKSTLLNALLGEKALPMDLVPTTGAAITVKYGLEPRTRITRIDGSIQEDGGTGALKEFAVLDEQRRMREDVAAVEVYCPHPLLKLGLELVDLPGTDDREAQDALVQQQLLSADLVIQVLDGRKLMTLAERENLRDWLLDRGINTVIFVVNFLNLMEAEDRQQVALRLRFLAESFRSALPAGVSNLYQVDALPALRARLKGDMAAATQSGLPALESALQTIGQQMVSPQEGAGRSPELTSPRLKVIALKLPPALQSQIDALSDPPLDPTNVRRAEVKTKAQTLIQQGFDQSVQKLRTWLAPDNLRSHYRLGLAQALETKTTQDWLLKTLKPAWYERQKPLVSWVHQACDFFDQPRPVDLWMAFSVAGEDAGSTGVESTDAKTTDAKTTGAKTTNAEAAADVSEVQAAEVKERAGIAPVAIATGLGWVLGGPLGAAILAGTS